jgi:uncharacterized protein (DUF1778 family)
MQLDEYLTQVHEHLTATAALGDERTQQIAGTLATAAGAAVRLAILSALSEAADEITAALLDSPGAPSVAVRLDGNDVRVDVTASEPEPSAVRTDDGDTNARISLRLSEALKTDVEDAAARDGVSVNSWLIRAANSALAPSWPGAAGFAMRGDPRGRGRQAQNRGNNPHHVTGWING